MASKVVMTQKGEKLRKDLFEEFQSPFVKIQNTKLRRDFNESPARREFSKSTNLSLMDNQFVKPNHHHSRHRSMAPDTKLARLENMHKATERRRQAIVDEIRFKAIDKRKISFNFWDVKNMKADNDKMRKMLNKGTRSGDRRQQRMKDYFRRKYPNWEEQPQAE